MDQKKEIKANDGRRVAKPSTAAEWAESHLAEWASLEEAFAASDLPIGILNELPQSMKDSIARHLNESFAQDYWDNISVTMMGDAERVLRTGIAEGQSIHDMAVQLRGYFEEGGFRYARARSENIARTESANALNSARKESVATLQRELGNKVPIKQSWLSVLGNTTRATHAELDGVPENENAMWILSGYEIPWPGHFSLSAEERCNCQCSLTIEFGMQEDEAQQLIGDYNERVEEFGGKSLLDLWRKHLSGQHDQSSHGSGGGGKGSIFKGFPKRPSSDIDIDADIDEETFTAHSTYETVSGRKYMAVSEKMEGYRVEEWMSKADEEQTDEVEAFEYSFKDEGGSYRVTGAGNAKEVIERSVQELMNHVEEMDMDMVVFTAMEPSRQRLYGFITSRSERLMPGFVGFSHKDVDGSYAVVRKKFAKDVDRGKRLRARRRKSISVLVKAIEEESEEFWDDPDFWDDVEDGILHWGEESE